MQLVRRADVGAVAALAFEQRPVFQPPGRRADVFHFRGCLRSAVSSARPPLAPAPEDASASWRKVWVPLLFIPLILITVTSVGWAGTEGASPVVFTMVLIFGTAYWFLSS